MEITIDKDRTYMIKFTPNDIGKYIVMKFRYEEHLFCGGPLGTQLVINYNKLNVYNKDMLYGVYRIDWHNDYQKSQNNVSYKVKLTPMGNWAAWCPDRSWYTSDIESLISIIYDLSIENPIFDSDVKATDFALNKNHEMYPDARSICRKIKDKVFGSI